jgi:hypothetical protein
MGVRVGPGRGARSARTPNAASEGELADFETEVLAGFVLARASAGLADSTIRNDTNHHDLAIRYAKSAAYYRTRDHHRRDRVVAAHRLTGQALVVVGLYLPSQNSFTPGNEHRLRFSVGSDAVEAELDLHVGADWARSC